MRRRAPSAKFLSFIGSVVLGTIAVISAPLPAADFDGDGKNDVAVFRPADGTWYIVKSSDGSIVSRPWGTNGDSPAWGDYDGDGKADVAVFRPSDGKWYIIRSSDGGITAVNWGTNGDRPVPGDYDGDGKTDLAVWRPGDGTWYILHSVDGGIVSTPWGSGGMNDVPAPGDYDGDGKSDLAVWRPGNGTWYIIRSVDGGIVSTPWGSGALNDIPVPADYDGDGKTDLAVWRPGDGTWFVVRSSDGGITAVNWGTNGDRPVPGDYDGDGKTDLAVWRPSDGNWYVMRSSDGGFNNANWGSGALNDNPQRGTSRGLDIVAIAARMNQFFALYATEVPSAAQLDPFFHMNYLNSGETKEAALVNFSTGGNGPKVGSTYSSLRIEDVLSTLPKTCLVSFVYNDPSGRKAHVSFVMRKEGSVWQLYGDQRVMQLSIVSKVIRETWSPPTLPYTINGINLDAGDYFGTATTVQSIVVTGPGLPGNGVVLTREGGASFSMPSNHLGSPKYKMYNITSDSVIGSIPDGALYTFDLYNQGGGTGALLYTYQIRNGKRPYLWSEITDSIFPQLISPATHNLSAANPGGTLNVTYAMPAGHAPLDASLYFTDGASLTFSVEDRDNPASYSLDSAGLYFTPSYGILFIRTYDQAARRQSMISWYFDSP